MKPLLITGGERSITALACRIPDEAAPAHFRYRLVDQGIHDCDRLVLLAVIHRGSVSACVWPDEWPYADVGGLDTWTLQVAHEHLAEHLERYAPGAEVDVSDARDAAEQAAWEARA